MTVMVDVAAEDSEDDVVLTVVESKVPAAVGAPEDESVDEDAGGCTVRAGDRAIVADRAVIATHLPGVVAACTADTSAQVSWAICACSRW